jgi:hypothetical protein
MGKGTIKEIKSSKPNDKGYITQNISLEGDETNYFMNNKPDYILNAEAGDVVIFEVKKTGTNDKGNWALLEYMKKSDNHGSSEPTEGGSGFGIKNAIEINRIALNDATSLHSVSGRPWEKDGNEVDFTAKVLDAYERLRERLMKNVLEDSSKL